MNESQTAENSAVQQLTFNQGMLGEWIMLTIALVCISQFDLEISLLGDIGGATSIVSGFAGAIIIYVLLWSTYQLPGYFMDDLRSHLTAIRAALVKMPNWQLMVLALAAGIAEELLFRAVLQTWLVSEIGLYWGILAASMMFGLAHFISIPYVIVTALTGIGLGYLYAFTDSLMLVMIIHAVYDAIAFLVICERPQWLNLAQPIQNISTQD